MYVFFYSMDEMKCMQSIDDEQLVTVLSFTFLFTSRRCYYWQCVLQL